MHSCFLRATSLAATFLLAGLLNAQGVDPVGRVHPNAQPLASVATYSVPALDRLAIAQDDEQRVAAHMPPRFAMPNAVQIDPATHGSWEQLDADWSLWRLRIQAPDASHINLGFRQFHLPASARLMVYSADYSMVVRPFDVDDNSVTGELWTPVVNGAEIVVELYVLTRQRPQVLLHLTDIGAGYRMFGAGTTALGTDAAGACEVDVVCPQAAGWANEIHSVARISIGGSSLCSGCLVNNTAQDGKNYFLTADHCGAAGNPASVVAYWNYEHTTCGGSGGSLSQFTSGAVLRATANSSLSDFTLLEFTGTINSAYGVTYAGWNRTTATQVSTSAVGIHHPDGDVKKISFENQATVTTSYGGTSQPGNGRYVRVIDWDLGVTEPGSSGSPLFDQNHRVIGQLSGGGSACGNNLSDWYGKFGASWTGGGTSSSRLSNWLDPLNTGQTTLDTFSAPVAATESFGTGCYLRTSTFFELFSGGSFDLGGTPTTTASVAFLPIPNGYQVAAGPNAWFTPTSSPLAMTDDGLVLVNLPWTFQAPGGSTAVAQMAGNGFLWLNGTSTDGDYTPTGTELATGPKRFAPLWVDLNVELGGSCHYDVDPSGTAVYFTWLDVPAYTTGTPGPGNTFQLVLRQDQSVEYRYRSVPNTPTDCIVGWGRGGTLVPAGIDLSVRLPFQVTTDGAALSFSPLNRPIQGTTQQILLQNIVNPTGSIGLVLAGPRTTGIELSLIGMPECFLYQTADIQFAFLTPAAAYLWTVFIPTDVSLTGAKIACQGALLSPGVNAFGALSANAVELTFGTQ